MASVNSIFFGTIDSTVEEAAILAEYQLLTTSAQYPNGITPTPGDPEFQIIATIAYARVLCKMDLERAGKCNLIQYATGANLDYLAQIIGLIRILNQPSVVQIQFTLVPGHGQVVIPGGTQVSSQDGLAVYATNEDTIVLAGQNTIIVDATCTTEGSSTNGYAIGTIITIQNPQPYLLSASNINITSGGTDVETDASFVARWYTALEALSVAGPSGAYKFFALSADLTIISVVVLGPEDEVIPTVDPGTVEIVILTNTGVPTQPVIDAVLAACNPVILRPCCDFVKAYGATPINRNLYIGVTALIGSNTLAMGGLVATAVQTYLTTQSQTIGVDIVDDDIIVAAKTITGVKEITMWQDAAMTIPFNDVVVNERSFGVISLLNVTITSVVAP